MCSPILFLKPAPAWLQLYQPNAPPSLQLTSSTPLPLGIRDLSLTGAQVSGDGPIPHSCDAVFKRGSLFVAARVMRSRDSEGGVQFYGELTPAELDSMFQSVLR